MWEWHWVPTSPFAPYPGCQPRTDAGQKAHFPGRSELAAPHLSSVLPPSPKNVKRHLSIPYPRIVNHGLTNDKYLLGSGEEKRRGEGRRKKKTPHSARAQILPQWPFILRTERAPVQILQASLQACRALSAIHQLLGLFCRQ